LSELEDVLRLDPAMKVLMEVARQDGMERSIVEDMYEQVCLGERSIGSFFLEVERRITDEALLVVAQNLRKSLRIFSSDVARPQTLEPPLPPPEAPSQRAP